MDEYNRNPLAQQAKKALNILKVSVEPGESYALKLIREGLENKSLCPVSNQQQADLLTALDYLDGNPEMAMELLTRGPGSDPNEEYPLPSPDLKPEQLVQDLVYTLQISLMEIGAMPQRSAL